MRVNLQAQNRATLPNLPDGGGARVVQLDARDKPVKPPPAGKYRQATPHEKGAAVEIYFDGLSYRKTAGNMDQFFRRDTDPTAVYQWRRDLSKKADPVLRPAPVLRPVKVDAGTIRVAGCAAIILRPMRPRRGQRIGRMATALAMARERVEKPPVILKTDRLASYRDAIPRAFPTHKVNHMVSQGVKAEINNNLRERLQGIIRDRDQTLRGLKARETGQAYVDGLVTHYNYFRPHESLKGKKPAEAAGAELPFDTWEDVAAMKS